jgi:hypothetical protein
MSFDPSYVLASTPTTAPSEFKLLSFRTYLSPHGKPLDCSRQRVERSVERDRIKYASKTGAKPCRYLIGTREQLTNSGPIVNGEQPHLACADLEIRDDGLYAVGVTFHGEDHLALSRILPLAKVNAADGELHLMGFILGNEAELAEAELELTPWSKTPYGQCAIDFAIAYGELFSEVDLFPAKAQRPMTLLQVRELEERIKTHLTSMKVNAECCDSMREKTHGDA